MIGAFAAVCQPWEEILPTHGEGQEKDDRESLGSLTCSANLKPLSSIYPAVGVNQMSLLLKIILLEFLS